MLYVIYVIYVICDKDVWSGLVFIYWLPITPLVSSMFHEEVVTPGAWDYKMRVREGEFYNGINPVNGEKKKI